MRTLAAIFAVFAGAALMVLAAPSAKAQDTPFKIAQDIETAFADVETSRLAGDCPTWRKRLDGLTGFLGPVSAPDASSFSPAVREEYRTRLAEAAARPCPPRAAVRAVQPPVAIAPPVPLPRTVTLEDLRLELAEACGSAFEPARERFITALDRAITAEQDPTRKGYLRIDRAAVLRLKPPPCRSAEAPPARVSNGDIFATRRYYSHANELRRHLTATEQARYAGDCVRRQTELDAAWAAYEAMQASGYTPPTRQYDFEVLTEQSARRCVPRHAAAVPAPPPPALPPTPPKPATGAVRPAAPIASPVAGAVKPCGQTWLDQRTSGEGNTCRCAGPSPFLMVWGSDPYRASSAICSAAIHAGALPPSGIGVVRLIPVELGKAALGSTRNGVSTYNWDLNFEGAFTVEPGNSASREQPGEAARETNGRYMFGYFDTTFGVMFLNGGKGTYETSGGTITPTRIDGTILEGVWEQTTASRRCPDGRYRGRLRFVFTETGFVGTWSHCDDPLDGSWSGLRREARP